MQVAKHYKELLNKALLNIKSGEPLSFVGMYDCGKNYLFSLLIEELKTNPIGIIPMIVDIQDSEYRKVLDDLSVEVSLVSQLGSKPVGQSELLTAISRIGEQKKLVFIVNIGYGIIVDKKVFDLFLQLRNRSGWNVNIIFFANTGFLFQTSIPSPLFDKVFKKNICPIFPLSPEDGELILHKYENRYEKKVDSTIVEQIIRLSGGNPGFIKGLYLQSIEQNLRGKPNIYDERIFYRIHRLVKELPISYQQLLINFPKHSISEEPAKTFFETFGYTTKHHHIFSTLVELYLHQKQSDKQQLVLKEDIEDIIRTQLTHAEQLIYSCVWKTPNKIVTRDSIAQALWGDSWADKYSDWAIDQCIHTLREKLQKITSLGSIKTKKGEGYIYSK